MTLDWIPIQCFHKQMVTVCHQAIGVAQPMESPNNLCRCAQKYQAILVILENRFAPITSRGHVTKGAGKFNTKGTFRGL